MTNLEINIVRSQYNEPTDDIPVSDQSGRSQYNIPHRFLKDPKREILDTRKRLHDFSNQGGKGVQYIILELVNNQGKE